jgi:hypothetical protein
MINPVIQGIIVGIVQPIIGSSDIEVGDILLEDGNQTLLEDGNLILTE